MGHVLHLVTPNMRSCLTPDMLCGAHGLIWFAKNTIDVIELQWSPLLKMSFAKDIAMFGMSYRLYTAPKVARQRTFLVIIYKSKLSALRKARGC